MPPLVVGELRVPFLLAAALLLLTALGTGSAQNGSHQKYEHIIVFTAVYVYVHAAF